MNGPRSNTDNKQLLKWGAAALLAAVFVTAYWEIIALTIDGWTQFARSYGLLIFAISLYMLWDKKDEIRSTIVKPSPLYGGILTFAGCMLLLVSKLSSTLMLQGLALIITVLGIVWAVMGRKQLGLFLLPTIYMLFMFSLIEEFLGFISKWLQFITAQISAVLLSLKGMPVFVSNEIIQLPHITLRVAKACNGVNHIVALIALAIPMAVLSKMTLYKKILFVLLAFLIGLVANGVRVAMIGWWTIKHSESSIHGPFELFYVSFILIFGLAIMGGVRLIAGRGNRRTSAAVQAQQLKSAPHPAFWAGFKPLPLLTSALIIAVVFIYQIFSTESRGRLLSPLESFPYIIESYSGQDVDSTDWPFKHIAGDQIMRRIYVDESKGARVGLTVSYMNNQKQDKEIINQQLMWLHAKVSQVSIPLVFGFADINRDMATGMEDHSFAGDKRVIYFFYFIDGKIITNPYRAKLAVLLRALLARRSDAAFVAFSDEGYITGNQTGKAEMVTFISKAIPVLMNHLESE